MPNYSNTVNTNIAGMQLYDPFINNHSNTWPSYYHQNYITQQQAMQYPRYPFMPNNYFNPVSNHPMYQVVMVPHLVPVVPVPQSTSQIHAPIVQAPTAPQSQPVANSSTSSQQSDHIISPSSSNATGASGFGGFASSTNPNAIIEQMLMQDANYQDEIIRVCMMQERANQDKLVQERINRDRANGCNGPRLAEEDTNEVKVDIGMFPFGNNADYQQHYNIYNPESLHFLRFLDKGCEIAEKVSIRNQHRACFKNVHNLCYRTRNEINHPYPTISNIHSQGIPYATKDFIYAFVRMINCWHLMKGYIQLKEEGLLGHIHSELSDEFRTCFRKWEMHTIEISKHLVRIITNLDGNIRNPAPLPVFQALRQGISVCNNEQTRESPDSSDNSSSTQSNSELSTPHGKYNHENFTPGIEFLPVATNVDHYLQKMAGESKFTEEEEWVNALASCNFYSNDSAYATLSRKESKSLLREIYPFDDPSVALLNNATEATVQEIQSTEANDTQLAEKGAIAMANLDESSTASPHHSDEEIKKSTTPRTIGPPSGRRIKAKEELEMDVMRKLLEEIKQTDLYKTLHCHSPQKIFHCRDNLHAIISNYYYKYYASTKIMFYDIERVIAKVQKYFINDSTITKQVADFTVAMNAFKKIHCQDVKFEENGRIVDDTDAHNQAN